MELLTIVDKVIFKWHIREYSFSYSVNMIVKIIRLGKAVEITDLLKLAWTV